MGLFIKLKKKQKNKNDTQLFYDTAARYQLEHQILPQLFLGQDGAAIIGAVIKEKGNFFTGLYKNIHKEDKKYHCPYSPNEFKIQCLHFNENNPETFVLHIKMPKPERVPLCSSVFVVHDKNLKNIRYITTELSNTGNFVICEWNSTCHLYYCDYSEKELLKILKE